MVLAGIRRELVFTGTSKLGINPETNRFCSHIDTWDAIQNQDYFSVEAFLHMIGQLFAQRPEALRGEVLLKRDAYEVLRRDGRFVAVPVHGSAGVGKAARERDASWTRALERDGLTFTRETDGTVVLQDFSWF